MWLEPDRPLRLRDKTQSGKCSSRLTRTGSLTLKFGSGLSTLKIIHQRYGSEMQKLNSQQLVNVSATDVSSFWAELRRPVWFNTSPTLHIQLTVCHTSVVCVFDCMVQKHGHGNGLRTTIYWPRGTMTLQK